MFGCQLTSDKSEATGIDGRENIAIITNGETMSESGLEMVEAVKCMNDTDRFGNLLIRLKINESEGIILQVDQCNGPGEYNVSVDSGIPAMQYFVDDVLYFPCLDYQVVITSVTPKLCGYVENVILRNPNIEAAGEKMELSFSFTAENVEGISQADIPVSLIEDILAEETIPAITRGPNECGLAAWYATRATMIYNQILFLESHWWLPQAWWVLPFLWSEWGAATLAAAAFQAQC